ncbi:MAG: hypothetical protein H0X11_14535 [Betaproteobacteria bacterium]|nr:hypothetical protein [Betaproteobacteria bacterium]
MSLAKKHGFARRLVNSGRLSVPTVLRGSKLNTPDRDADFATTTGAMMPGAPAADAPVSGPRGDWLLDYLAPGFTLLTFGDATPVAQTDSVTGDAVSCRIVQVGGGAQTDRTVILDETGLVARRYEGQPGTSYLLRPDQHVCARWRAFDANAVRGAIARATGTA